MVNSQSNKQQDNYFRVICILSTNPKITQRALAKKLGVSLSGVNYCMKALILKGWVKMQNFSQNTNKMEYAYLLTPKGMTQKAALTNSFLKRKMLEYEALRAEIEALQIENKP
jgi:EPS-associated MarR family transcriptional regulator